MNAWCWNGSAFEHATSLPLSDRGFRYGMALFETVRLFHGRALFLAGHLEKLRTAATTRAFPFPEPALTALVPLLSQPPDGVARLYLTAGDSQKFTDEISAPRLFVLCEPRPAPDLTPCSLTIASAPYHAPFGGLKTANYWANIDALQQAQRAGFDEALLFNENAELVSAATANVFLVRDGEIRTPSLACGARAGVIREWVMSQTPVRECSLFIDDVRIAHEVFLTNSWYGIRPVTNVDETPQNSCEAAAKLGRTFDECALNPVLLKLLSSISARTHSKKGYRRL